MGLIDDLQKRCTVCGTQYPEFGIDMCRTCFRFSKKDLLIEERLLDLEMAIIRLAKHQHLENMRF